MTQRKRNMKWKVNIPDRAISIAALTISLVSAAFSYLQARSSEQQLLLNSQQLRPHITHVPTFFPENNEIRIDMYVQNNSPLPARVIFSDIAASVDGKEFGEHFYSMSPDIIYQSRDGVSTLPPIPRKYSSKIVEGKSSLVVATCTIYSPTADTDKRRWIINILSEYVPGIHVGSRKLIEEHEVDSSLDKCDAKTVFAKDAKNR